MPTSRAHMKRRARRVASAVRREVTGRLNGRRTAVAEQPPPPLPPQLTDAGSRRSVLPLPEGWSRGELTELLSSMSIEGAPPGELATYVDLDFERFVLTWDLVRGEHGRLLEIGANPYFTTVLLREFTDLDITLTNSFGGIDGATDHQRVNYRGPAGSGIAVDTTLSFLSLNVEASEFPFESGEFSVVLFCEVIEHLLNDPVAALSEINRVLDDEGVVVVSTPNVARLENVARLAAGANIYDPYSGYGPYGRHNREFTRHELVRLLEFCGFTVDTHFTVDVHPHATAGFVDPALLEPVLGGRLPDLGQYIFCRAVKSGPPPVGRPAQMYRSWTAHPLVDLD